MRQPGSHRGSAAVNEHGAVNFSNLHTDDVEAARAFHGAVFGWTTIDAGSPMWALPGYGDHLEELNPGLRAGMKQMGAPEGFENVVATILPCEGGPARWSVTFAVDDADATAARARRLGHRRAAQCAVGAIRRPCVLEGLLITVALQALRAGTNVVLDFGLWGRDERRHCAGWHDRPGHPARWSTCLLTRTSSASGSHTARRPPRTRHSR